MSNKVTETVNNVASEAFKIASMALAPVFGAGDVASNRSAAESSLVWVKNKVNNLRK